MHSRNIRGGDQRRSKSRSADECRSNGITVTTLLLALFVSFRRAARTATKQANCVRNCEFCHHRLLLQSQSLLYLARMKACQHLSPRTQLAIASGSLPLSKHKTHAPNLILWPKAAEHVFAYRVSSGNAVSNT